MTALCKLALVVLGTTALLSATRARADGTPEHGFLDRTHKDPDGKDAKYVLFVPHAYEGDKAYPLILFLHGAGETGTDGKRQVKVGLGPVVRRDEAGFPFFVIFPQSQKRTWQAKSSDAQRALDILAEVRREYKIDGRRIYLTGLSMGGFGTWSLAAAHPDRWAAIAPICGGGDPKIAEKIKEVPCWCFHGGADPVVKVEWSRNLMKALWDAGGHPNYTEYPGVGHNSWDKAYATRDLYEWFLKHRLRTTAASAQTRR
jgi:predicted peptidase